VAAAQPRPLTVHRPQANRRSQADLWQISGRSFPHPHTSNTHPSLQLALSHSLLSLSRLNGSPEDVNFPPISLGFYTSCCFLFRVILLLIFEVAYILVLCVFLTAAPTPPHRSHRVINNQEKVILQAWILVLLLLFLLLPCSPALPQSSRNTVSSILNRSPSAGLESASLHRPVYPDPYRLRLPSTVHISTSQHLNICNNGGDVS
jgi:hypothetical protein